MYYIPTEEEIRVAQIHSERADIKGNRLEKRFGHPALHMELFTPMLHAKMMPLLAEVYKGKINSDHAKLGEYGGQKVEAQVIEDGIRFAGVDQRDLEYDPTLYQRDRGEQDWDARSMATANILGDGPSLHASKSQFYANSSRTGSPAPSVYDRYMVRGPVKHNISGSEIELNRMGDPSADRLPLLNNQQEGYFEAPPVPQQQQQQQSTQQFQPYSSPHAPPQSQYPPMYRNEGDGYREAPIHRPYPHERQNSGHLPQQAPSYNLPPHSRHMSGYPQYSNESQQNMAGRGVYRG